MHKITMAITAAVAAMLPYASADGPAILAPRVLDDPIAMYLSEMCYPLFSNRTRAQDLRLSANEQTSSLVDSPFPCEQALYIRSICTANGTTEIDFLAEQQCLCNGSYFEVSAGCTSCYLAHGYQGYTPEEITSSQSSLSSAECSPTPPYQPFSNLLPPVNITSARLLPSLTLGNDRFPSDTAVSNYFTAAGSVSAGAITGSATARLTSWTNYRGIRYSPTSTPSSSGYSTTPPTSAATDSASSSGIGTDTASGTGTGTSSVPGSTTAPNFAGQLNVRYVGSILVSGLCVVILM